MEAKLLAVFSSGVPLRVTALCRELEISRQTLYKYRRRFEAEGPAGLVELEWGLPAHVMNDNGSCFTGRLGKHGAADFERMLRSMGITASSEPSVAALRRGVGHWHRCAPHLVNLPKFTPEPKSGSGGMRLMI